MIYRKNSVAPITLASFTVSELEYGENKGIHPSIKRSNDPAIIQELMGTLRAKR